MVKYPPNLDLNGVPHHKKYAKRRTHRKDMPSRQCLSRGIIMHGTKESWVVK